VIPTGLIVLGACGATAGVVAEADLAFFESRVRPVLVEHCGECHLGGKAKGGLRMDSRTLLMSGGDSGSAMVAGDPGASLMIRAVRYEDPDLRMPPRHRLPASAVKDLEEWVRRGAPDPRPEPESTGAQGSHGGVGDGRSHWAVQPVQAAVQPAGPGAGTGLDAFIRTKLSAAGLDLSPAADDRTWIRRVTLDLIGLPPTPAEVDGFLADGRPDARARWVDRLLSDPAYGERWARWWLDVARYADTNGQDENKVMANAWRYRDWVVRAFNADLPFDRFAMAQIAGDLLPAEGVDERERMDRVIATGFLVLGPKLLAEQDKPKLVMDIVDEQVDTVGRAFLGLTLGCARCHDHKFDPVSQREYYALAGIFHGTRTMENLSFVSKFNERSVATAEELFAIKDHAEKMKASEAALESAVRDADAALVKEWARHLPAVIVGKTNDVPTKLLERVERWRTAGGATDRLGGLLAGVEPVSAVDSLRTSLSGVGPVPGWRGGAFAADGKNRVERSEREGAVGKAWALAAWVRRDAESAKEESRRWIVSRGGNEWVAGHLALVVDGDKPGAYLNVEGGQAHVVAAWGPAGRVPVGTWVHLAAVFGDGRLRVFVNGEVVADTAAAALPAASRDPWVIGMRPDGYVGLKGRVDGVRVFGRGLQADEVHALHSGTEPEGALVSEDFDPTTPEAWAAVETRRLAEDIWAKGGLLDISGEENRRKWYSPADRARVTALESERDQRKAIGPGPAAKALAVADATVTNLPVMIRGSHLNPTKDPVPRGFLRWVGTLPVPTPGPTGSGRLELAQWLVHPANPLTPRVLVNRVWAAHFGQGLVRSPENFGLRGEVPTHPELLDWLASRFVAGGWSLKALHREIVLSETYGQSAAVEESRSAKDPENRWLHRFPRQRLEAETLRDAVLSVSGQLDRRVGGTLVAWGNDDYVPGDEAPFQEPRRTLYLPVVRDRGTDLMTAFDGANPSVSMPQRTSTVVAPQALFLMNSPMVLEAARRLGAKVAGTGEASDAAVDVLYRAVLGRRARETERERAVRLLADERLVKLPGNERWAVLAQVLLCSNEFTHRE